ncbi:hypothetical protein [Microbispora sp. H11081]|uniref:hypothetical protein n=1 Tax=Microbispora sp. H11081 TaxID=2729107 RepID=UPI0014748575|nr:hypothetical protein [Microbispora sp. H11081]
MRSIEDVLTYARAQADALEQDMIWTPGDYGGGWWAASPQSLQSRIVARAAAALEFLRQYAGPNSFWTLQATTVYNNKGENQSTESGARAIGELLRAWADQVEAGIVEIVGARAWAEFGVASTDLMSQVRRLLEDHEAHPAAAIVLCGAALEIALRAAAEAHSLVLPPRPTLSTLTALLRSANLITKQDVKDIEACGGIRNAAAHGLFDELSRERAGVMELQTNILLRRLADLHSGPNPEQALPA